MKLNILIWISIICLILCVIIRMSMISSNNGGGISQCENQSDPSIGKICKIVYLRSRIPYLSNYGYYACECKINSKN